MNELIMLRPHHLLDLLKDYGNKKKITPHPFGASVPEITNRVFSNIDQVIQMVPRVDSICVTCRMLDNNICQAKIRDNLLMREYNDNLDDKLFKVMNLTPYQEISIAQFIRITKDNLDIILGCFTSPDNNRVYRKKGTKSAISEFINQTP